MAAIYSNGGNRWNILGFNFNKRDALSSVYKISMIWCKNGKDGTYDTLEPLETFYHGSKILESLDTFYRRTINIYFPLPQTTTIHCNATLYFPILRVYIIIQNV